MIKFICEKTGHFEFAKRRSYMQRPPAGAYRTVLQQVSVIETACICGHVKKEHILTTRDFNSVSMPQSDWDILEKTGRVYD